MEASAVDSGRVDQDVDDQTKRSVDAIVRLHGIVIALALTTATAAFVKPLLGTDVGGHPSDNALSTTSLHYFTLLATAIPFYHGANRHMDVAHVFAPIRHIRAVPLMLDFLFLFAEAVEFLALASTLGDSVYFYTVLYILILTDTAWGLLSFKTAHASVPTDTVTRWKLLNAAFLSSCSS